MENETIHVSFPVIDLEEILVPWENCLRITIGPISEVLVKKMIEKRYDYAPVSLSDASNSPILGLVSRQRLESLLKENKELTREDKGIILAEVPVMTNLDYVLERLAEVPTRIVSHDIEAEGHSLYGVYGIVNKSDLNKPPVRKIIYEILAKLEITLAEYINSKNIDTFSLIELLNEDSQARILGYWELARRKNVDTGPLTGAMLSELLRIAAKYLYAELGFKSKNELEKITGCLPEIRNQVMHPVRPLITDEKSCLRLKEALYNAILITKKVQAGLPRQDRT
ncbi:MAG: hypothetical protein N3B16_01580 [Candidatus Aminicenantes bacterium]|nr:hypothetical protein [Candidatus Aminicenantes bacterium]